MLTSYLVLFCRSTIALLFIFSFGSKALALREFVVTIGDFKLLPHRWSRAAALLLLGGELITALLVIIGGGMLAVGFLLAAALLTIFSVALISVLRRKIAVGCNCFGRTERRVSYYDVARNVYLLLCSFVGLIGLIVLGILKRALQDLPSGELILLVVMSAFVLFAVIHLGEVVETLRQPFPVMEERR